MSRMKTNSQKQCDKEKGNKMTRMPAKAPSADNFQGCQKLP